MVTLTLQLKRTVAYTDIWILVVRDIAPWSRSHARGFLTLLGRLRPVILEGVEIFREPDQSKPTKDARL